MEKDDIAKHIEDQVAALPADVRDAVMSVEWEQKVQAIAQKHALHIDQAGALGDMTLLAMLGDFKLDEYPKRIAEGLSIPADKAAAVAADVNHEVFTAIRESLKTFTEHQATSAPAPIAPAAATPPPPKPATPVPQEKKPDVSPADMLLHAATVTSAPAVPNSQAPSPAKASTTPPANPEAPKPQSYAADPYREPPV